METFRDRVGDNWHEADEVQHALATTLGLVPATSYMRHYKWIYWSNNPLGNALFESLMNLVRAGMLEVRDEPDWQFRWSPEFVEPETSIPLDR